MKTYKLIKPIGDYPLEEYTKEWDKYVIAKTLEFEWGGSYKVFHYIPAEIVENMPEYFVEVKENKKTKKQTNDIIQIYTQIPEHTCLPRCICKKIKTTVTYGNKDYPNIINYIGEWYLTRNEIEQHFDCITKEDKEYQEYQESIHNDIIKGNIYKNWTIQIKHCNCWCDNIGKL